MDKNFLYSLSISCIILAISYDVCYRSLRFEKRVSIVIGFGFGIIVFMFLSQNSEILNNTVITISMIMISLIIGLAKLIRGKNH